MLSNRQVIDLSIALPSSEPCPECGGSGKVECIRDNVPEGDAVLDDLEERDCPVCHGRPAPGLLFKKSGIPRKYQACSFASYVASTVLLKRSLVDVLAYLANHEWRKPDYRNLFIYGRPGVGKTHLLAAIVRHLAMERIASRFVKINDLLRTLKRSFTGSTYHDEMEDEDKTTEDILLKCFTPRILLMDDLGAGNATPWAEGVLSEILDRRGDNFRPFVITTNYSPDELDTHVGERVASRAVENCRVVHFVGRDYRRRDLKK